MIILSGQKEPSLKWIYVKAKTFPRLSCSYESCDTVLTNEM